MERGNILGVGISATNMPTSVAIIEKWLENREQNYVLNIPAHLIVDAQRDPGLRRVINGAGLVNPDGMPVAWILRIMGFRQVDRVYGPDLMLAICQRSVQRGYKHFLYGGWPPEVTERLAAKLRERFPGLQIVGVHAPPFRPLTPEEDQGRNRENQRRRPRYRLVRIGCSKRGILDQPPYRQSEGDRPDWRRRCLRFSFRHQAASSALDDARRPRMVLSIADRTQALVETVFVG